MFVLWIFFDGLSRFLFTFSFNWDIDLVACLRELDCIFEYVHENGSDFVFVRYQVFRNFFLKVQIVQKFFGLSGFYVTAENFSDEIPYLDSVESNLQFSLTQLRGFQNVIYQI